MPNEMRGRDGRIVEDERAGQGRMTGATMFDRIWDAHVIADLGDDWSLLHVDRHLLHDLTGGGGLQALTDRALTVRNPELTFATADHAVSSAPGRTGATFPAGKRLWSALRSAAREADLHYFELGEAQHGILHVVGPEQGITLPGLTMVCGDSHSCTHGGLGALAFGIGSSELTHVLATQTLRQRRPRTFRISFEGRGAQDVTAKDMILHLIARLGTAAGTGYALEFAGSAVRALPVEGRLTLCNLAIELGAKIGMVAPDDIVFNYLAERPYAPSGAAFERAVEDWRRLPSDAGAPFDRDLTIDMAEVAPTITWGTSPEHAIPIDGIIPDPDQAASHEQAAAWRAALGYMGLEAGRPLIGTPIDQVFIGSCANSRLSDLRAAADVARGRQVSPGVTAWIVPGSEQVKRQAQAEGLDQVFLRAGFEWREPGCAMCVAANGERVSPGARAVSTSNRNFVGRQGPGARTHLASPAMAAAAAIAGAISDPRSMR